MKPLLIFCVSLLPFASIAQFSKPFKINGSAGYSIQPVSGARGGLLVGIEPRYALHERFELGLRLEGAFPSQPVPPAGYRYREEDRFKSTSVVSTILTVNYWLPSGHRSGMPDHGVVVRPYVGVGLGSYWASASIHETTPLDNGGQSVVGIDRSVGRFGGMARAGVKVGHLNVAVEYNLLGSTTQQNPDYSQSAVLGFIDGQPLYENPTRTLTWTTRNSYVGLKMGLDIGGGRR